MYLLGFEFKLHFILQYRYLQCTYWVIKVNYRGILKCILEHSMKNTTKIL